MTAALRIHRAGMAFRLLEARPRLGERILSQDEIGQVSRDGFDLGPSWFWPDMQPAFGRFHFDGRSTLGAITNQTRAIQ